MSRTLADVFDELADEVGSREVRPDLAAVAWQGGRRRRRRARAGRAAAVAAVAAAVLAAVVLALPGSLLLPAPPAAGDSTVGHPQRIAQPLVPQLVRDLPSRGDPLAGIAFGARDLQTPDNGTWYAVGQGGELWHLPIQGNFLAATVPAISPDGRRVAYSDLQSGRYVIRDVVTGRVTRFPTVGMQQLSQDPTQAATSAPPYRTDFQTPTYFSPDARTVAVRAFAGRAAAPVILLLGTDGSIRELPMEEGLTLAGWLDDTALLALRTSPEKGADGAVALDPIRWSLNGQRTSLPRLGGEGARVGWTAVSQWSPSLSPDRRTLALALDADTRTSGSPTAAPPSVVAFDLRTGSELFRAARTPGAADSLLMVGTPVEWRGDQWVLPGLETEGLRLEPEGDANPAQALVVTDPRLQLTRLDLAEQALAGPTHSSIWGTAVWTLSWRWREASLVAGVVVALLLWRGRRLRNRTESG